MDGVVTIRVSVDVLMCFNLPGVDISTGGLPPPHPGHRPGPAGE